MKKIVINVLKDVNGVPFGAEREAVRKEFGKKYKEMKKSIFSKNTMDAYDDFHIYYTGDNKFDAIEIFGKIEIKMNGMVVYPGKVSDIESLLAFPKKNSDGIISESMSVGITIDQGNADKIEAILYGSEGYFGK